MESTHNLREVVDVTLPTLAHKLNKEIFAKQNDGHFARWHQIADLDRLPAREIRQVFNRSEIGYRYQPYYKHWKDRGLDPNTVCKEMGMFFFNLRLADVTSLEMGDLDITNERNKSTNVIKYLNNSSSEIPLRRETETEKETEKTETQESELTLGFKQSFSVSGMYCGVTANASMEMEQNIKSRKESTMRALVKSRELGSREFIIKPYSRWEMTYSKSIADVAQDVTMTGRLEANVRIANWQNFECFFDSIADMMGALSGVSTENNFISNYFGSHGRGVPQSVLDSFELPVVTMTLRQKGEASKIEQGGINETFLSEEEKRELPAGCTPENDSEGDDWEMDI